MPSPERTGRTPRILVVANPVAGRRDFDESLGTITDYLEELGADYEIRRTKGDGDALEWVRTARGFDLVAAAGGDGTVMEALSGMIKNTEPVPLAQLPLGTANLLSRALGISSNLKKALETAFESGVVATMDVGYLPGHDRYFAIVAGSGWDAELIEDADRKMKNRLGFFAYVISGFRHLFDQTPSRVTIAIDGETRRFRAYEVMVINIGEIYGTGFALGKDLSPHDGKLDLAIASSRTVYGTVKLLSRILLRRFDGSSDLRYFSASHLKIEAEPPLKVEIDGEPVGETPFEVEVVPAGARMVVPRAYVEAKKLEFEELPGRVTL
ncbi:MAG: diacylglycerol kinase family protein [Verrucomicrobiales bacterium]